MDQEMYDHFLEDESFMMPLKIINEIEELFDSRKNEKKIQDLMQKHGTDICNDAEHGDHAEPLEWKHMGSDDEFEHHEQCVLCGGIIES